MRSPRSRVGKFVAAALVGAFALAACGGGDGASDGGGDAGSAADGGTLPAVAVADAVALDPSFDVSTNPLPDLVVDNLGDDNKVNLRNFGTSDKPILLWMWAPH